MSQISERMVKEVEKEVTSEHEKHIKAERQRREDILAERERVRLETERRKEKKRVKKMRLRLNSEREPNMVSIDELLEKYTAVQHILKHPERSNGFARDHHAKNAVYIAGGL